MRRGLFVRSVFVGFVLLISMVALPLLAQSTGGSISGVARDETGAVLPGVTLTVSSKATGLTRTTATNDKGAFTFPGLPVGSYDLHAELSGFNPVDLPGVTVNVGRDVTLKIGMRVGVKEAMTVTAEAPIIETTKSQVSTDVNERMIENLPTNGRNFIDFVLTTPGVVRDVRLGDISFAGQRGTLNSLVVDGADNNNTFFGQALGRTGSGRAPYQFSQDAVKEFQVNSNSYSAEYGRAGGAVINVVTKSGTNEVDGSAFYFRRDTNWTANNYINALNNRSKGPNDYDQFGFSVGGPLVRDKHFFFLNYDGQRNTFENTVVMNVPAGTPTDANTMAGLAILQPLAGSWNRGQNQDVFLVKTDHELGSAHLSARYNRQDFTGKGFENGGITNSFQHTGNSLVKTDTLTLDLTMPLSNQMFNEARVNWARDSEPGTANSSDPEATIRQGGQTVLTIGRNFFSPRETTIHRYQVADTFTYLTGNHTIKAGFDLNRDDILNYFPGNFSGSYTFGSIASFYLGVPNGPGERYVQAFAGPGTSGPTTHPNLFETALFVEDQWQIRPTFTINAGLRYDREGIRQPDVKNPDPQLAAAGLDTSRIPEDNNNIGPRLGFAWNPNAKTVVRGGFGIFYGRTPSIMYGTAMSNNGINVQTITFTGDQVPTYPNVFSSIPTGIALPHPTIFVFDPNYQNPDVRQASLGVDYALTDNMSMSVSYLYVDGRHLSRSTDINVGGPTDFTINLADGGTATVTRYTTRPFSNFARVIEFQSSANSKYNGVTIDFNKRFSKNWQARLSYTYGEVKDDKPDQTAVVPQSSDDAKFAQDPLNLHGDWALGDNNVRHHITLSGVWDLDYGHFGEGWKKALLGGWSISGIVNFQTGQPYTAGVNADLNNDGNTRNDRAPGMGRNSFTLPSNLSVDPRITKEIEIHGNTRLLLIAEAFNVFNANNVNGVQTTFYAYNSSTNTLTRQANFGTPTSSIGPRTIQLAAKILF